MTKIKKIILATTLTCIAVSTTTLSASAYYAPYNTSSSQFVVSYHNDTSQAHILGVNTRPSSGTGGVYVSITTSDGLVVAHKTFPYFSSTSDLQYNTPASTIRRIYAAPAVSGQTVTGELYYYIN